MAQSLILSVGADGRFAGMVVAELVRRGASVRGMVHKAENAGKVRARGVAEPVTGDLRDPKTLAAALKGVESAFYIAPAFLPDEAEVGIGFVTAAKDAGVCRIVFSSVIRSWRHCRTTLRKVPSKMRFSNRAWNTRSCSPRYSFRIMLRRGPRWRKRECSPSPIRRSGR
ncbi:MAG: hypothetical protein QOH31_1289 [Verrucomicrobiota bacterium]|jgi:hypothetical protein